jgi:membrane protease YdiL (CAAX protease family)
MLNRERYPWALFRIFLGLGILAALLAVPFPPNLLYVLFFTVALVATVGLGLFLARTAGFRISVFARQETGEDARPLLMLAQSALIGVGVGIFILLLIRLVFSSILPELSSRFTAEANVAIWQRSLISFNAAVLEELAFRLFLFSLFVWLLGKIRRKPEASPSPSVVWLANAIIAIGFGLAHLPRWSSIATLTPLVVATVVFLNSLGGLTFGYLYWRQGLEAAMLAHFAADIVLHVVGPAFLKT